MTLQLERYVFTFAIINTTLRNKCCCLVGHSTKYKQWTQNRSLRDLDHYWHCTCKFLVAVTEGQEYTNVAGKGKRQKTL